MVTTQKTLHTGLPLSKESSPKKECGDARLGVSPHVQSMRARQSPPDALQGRMYNTAHAAAGRATDECHVPSCFSTQAVLIRRGVMVPLGDPPSPPCPIHG